MFASFSKLDIFFFSNLTFENINPSYFKCLVLAFKKADNIINTYKNYIFQLNDILHIRDNTYEISVYKMNTIVGKYLLDFGDIHIHVNTLFINYIVIYYIVYT